MVLVVACVGVGCGSSSSTSSTSTAAPTTSSTTTEPTPAPTKIGAITVSSPAFRPGGAIPVQYTCDGQNESPPLQWHGVPAHTVELVLLSADLSGNASDAVQWAVANISPQTHSIPAGSLPPGAVVGRNSEGKAAWGGACGAKGQLHHIVFLLYALRKKLHLQSGFPPEAVQGAVKTSKLATGVTLAVYQRP